MELLWISDGGFLHAFVVIQLAALKHWMELKAQWNLPNRFSGVKKAATGFMKENKNSIFDKMDYVKQEPYNHFDWLLLCI